MLASLVSFQSSLHISFLVPLPTGHCLRRKRETNLSFSRDVWKPPGTPGLKCLSVEVTGPMMQAHAIIGIIVDVFLMGLPIWIVYKKMLFSRRTLQVILVFSVGIFAVLSGIIRFWYWKTLVFTIDS